MLLLLPLKRAIMISYKSKTNLVSSAGLLILWLIASDSTSVGSPTAGNGRRFLTPLVISTWNFPEATMTAWESLSAGKAAVESVVDGCAYCEDYPSSCGGSVGYGPKPGEDGEVTLDAMIMDGATMDVGSVGCLRFIKNAIRVAYAVLKHTLHTLLVGDLATDFALSMGFEPFNLTTEDSINVWNNWKNNNCQPNFRQDVIPDASSNCGPYAPRDVAPRRPAVESRDQRSSDAPGRTRRETSSTDPDHDTIGMVAIDADGNIAAGASTNGLTYKIPGRVGDSPITGAGAYADNDVGAAAGTGNGDIMMRFLPAFLVVELMRGGATPEDATATAIARIGQHYPSFGGALIAIDKHGNIGAACYGYANFPLTIMSADFDQSQLITVDCVTTN